MNIYSLLENAINGLYTIEIHIFPFTSTTDTHCAYVNLSIGLIVAHIKWCRLNNITRTIMQINFIKLPRCRVP